MAPYFFDFSVDTMLLDSRVLLLTMYHGFACYLAGFVQKLFTSCPNRRSSRIHQLGLLRGTVHKGGIRPIS
jgi:hypothetical protein